MGGTPQRLLEPRLHEGSRQRELQEQRPSGRKEVAGSVTQWDQGGKGRLWARNLNSGPVWGTVLGAAHEQPVSHPWQERLTAGWGGAGPLSTACCSEPHLSLPLLPPHTAPLLRTQGKAPERVLILQMRNQSSERVSNLPEATQPNLPRSSSLQWGRYRPEDPRASS